MIKKMKSIPCSLDSLYKKLAFWKMLRILAFLSFISSLIFISCVASYHWRHRNDPPQAIIRIIDHHGAIDIYFLKDIRSLKVITDIDLPYEHEYMPIEER